MRRVPVKATSYYNKWGTLVNRRASHRRVQGTNISHSSTSPANKNIPRSAKKKRAKFSTITVVVTVTLVIGGITTVALSSASGGTTPGQGDVQPMSANSSMNYFKNAQAAFVASGYQHTGFAVEFDSSCQQHSYGLVKNFFRSNPCEWLTRAYLAIHDGNVGEVLVALSWAGMPTASSAARYEKLLETKDAGNIIPLSRDTGPYKSVAHDEKYYTSGLDGSSVWNVQLQPVGPVPSAFVSGIFDKF